MKNNIIALLVFCMTCISCSTDENANEITANNLVGVWEISEVRTEPSSSLNLPKEIADILITEGCKLLVFTFQENGSATSASKLNHITFNATPTGLDVDCPTQTDTESSSWELVGDQLTITPTMGDAETFTIKLSSSTLIIAGEDIDASNYSGTDVVFSKK